MRVRVAEPADADALVAMYERLPEADRYHRFFSAVAAVDHFVETWLATADKGGVVIVAEKTDPSGRAEIVGDAGYALLASGDGELGMTILPAWRGWLGPYLLDTLCETAAANGVPNIEAEIMADNAGMMTLARSRGSATLEHPDHNIVRLIVPTAGSAPTWPPGPHERPRVLVEVRGGRWTAEDEARAHGLDVRVCAGPRSRRRGDCPVLRGERCPLAEGADAIFFALDRADDVNERLHAGHGDVHPDVPLLDRAKPAACAPAAEVAVILRALGRR